MSFFNFGLQSPPTKRPIMIPSPTSPFCTSPSQLQEVTLDQDLTLSNSIRSPSGLMRGRSVKEFEEQLTALKKENFNLKLRIYFLEERMGPCFNLDKENIVKNNVELNVEVESLRKEVEEKIELLEQASKALDLQDEEHKKNDLKKIEKIQEYELEIENLKTQLMEMKSDALSSPRSYPSDDYYSAQENAANIKELQEKINNLEDELSQEKESNAAVQIIIDQKDNRIKCLLQELENTNDKVTLYEKNIKEYEMRLDEAQLDLQQLNRKLMEKSNKYDELLIKTNELRKKMACPQKYDVEQKQIEKLENVNAELEMKLQHALQELRKSQDLVVLSNSNKTNEQQIDQDLISATESTASIGIQKKNSHVSKILPSSLSTVTTTTSPTTTVTTTTTTTTINALELLKKLEQIKVTTNENENIPIIVENIKCEFDKQSQKIIKLKSEQYKACTIIKTMIDSRNKINEEIIELKQRNNELEKELLIKTKNKSLSCINGGDVGERTTVCTLTDGIPFELNMPADGIPIGANSQEENTMAEGDDLQLVEHYKELIVQLEKKNELLIATLKERTSQMDQLNEQCQQILCDLKMKEEKIVDLEFELLTTTKNDKLLEEKDSKIVELNSELVKRTNDLQSLVNHELWEKNKQIEKLQSNKIADDKDDVINKLKSDLEMKEMQLNIINGKISELGIDLNDDNYGVQSSVTLVQSNDDIIIRQLKTDLETSEMLRRKIQEICVILSARLEELAQFLDSLLKQKQILGFLGTKENEKKVRDIIDHSLDLSRTFTMNMLNPEQTLLQLTNLTLILDDASSSLDSTIVDNAHETEIIDRLRRQIIGLKQEIKLRDIELNKYATGEKGDCSEKKFESTDEKNDTEEEEKSTLKCDNSESEWSEPDRSVSRARIGLLNDSLNSHLTGETTDDEDEVKNCRKNTIEVHKQLFELETKLSLTENLLKNSNCENKKLKQDLMNLSKKLEMSENDLHELKRRNEETQQTIKNQENLIGELQQLKDYLEKEIVDKDELQRSVNQLISEKEMLANKLYKERSESNMLELKLANKEDEINEMKMEYEELLLKRVKEIESKSETEIRGLQQSLSELQLDYTTNYIKKCQVELNFAEFNEIKQLLNDTLIREQELNDKYLELQDKYKIVRNDLDNATLQFSEAVLEKTKIINEKQTIMRQMNDLNLELSEVKETSMKQVNDLRMEKTKLLMKLSELETSNADLYNRVIKMQTKYSLEQLLSTSPPPPQQQQPLFKRQNSDNSGMEEMTLDDNKRNRFCGLMPSVDRLDGNSSPDLGIESDHGRFSSLETQLNNNYTNNVTRPLLHTLELTESMSNLLDIRDDNAGSVENCGDELCCQKTVIMASENNDLKRKLQRTRRALEDTVNQLTLANQRKKQVEKVISKQIHKTSQVLRKAKANLDSGSEYDFYKKK